MNRGSGKRLLSLGSLAAGSLLIAAVAAITSGCGSPSGGGGERAVSTYCPIQDVRPQSAVPLAVNQLPRAYYQSLSVRADTVLPITLFACDPDLGIDFTGLSWAITVQPINGSLSTPWSGTYDGSQFQVTYFPAVAGTDRFVYWVNDGVAWGNTAEIRINVLPVMTNFVVHGPRTVDEDSFGAYSASAFWSNGSVTPVVSGVAWAVTPSGYANMDPAGILTPVNVPPGNQGVLVQAQYNEPGGPVWQDSLTVTLIDTITRLNALTINGPSSVNESSSASYAASAFFDDGSVTDVTSTANWSVTPGTYASISGGTLTTFSVTSPQTETVQTSYIHSTGTQSDSLSVIINDNIPTNAPPAPIITAPTTANEGDSVSVGGSMNDPDGPPPYSYTLDYGDGNSLSGTTSGNNIIANYAYIEGNYTITLSVIDSGTPAANGSTTWNITIWNVAPSVAIIATTSASVGQSVLFSSTVTDQVDTVFTYQWDFEDDGTVDSTLANPTHAFSIASTYTVRLQVGDGSGWGSDTHTITVSGAANTPPNPVIGMSSFEPEGIVNVNASFNDPDGPTPYSYTLDFGDGNSTSGTTSASSVSIPHLYDGDGSYMVVIDVSDGAAPAGTGSDAWLLDVFNTAPTVAITAATSAAVGETVLFSSLVTDPADTVFTYLWDFGDGSTSSLANPNHAYTAASTYTVLLSVNDGDTAGTGTDTHAVIVGSAVAAGDLFFNRFESAGPKWELWSYSKAGGLSSHSNISTGLDPGVPVAFNGSLYFPGNDGLGDRQLWSWDITNGLLPVASSKIWPDDLAVYRGQLYFSANDGLLNRQLWSYNGISAPVQESFLTSGLQPKELIHFDGKIYFNGFENSSTGNQLWSYDLSGGLSTVTAVTGGLSPTYFTVFPAQIDSVTWDTRVYFSGRDPANSLYQLYAYDAANGLAQISTVASGMSFPPQGLIVRDGRLYYQGNPDGTAYELWSYHPLEGFLQRSSVSPAGLIPDFMTAYDGSLFMNGFDPASGNLQLLNYDEVGGLNVAYSNILGLNPTYLNVYDGDIYFNGLDTNDSLYMWSYNSSSSAATVAGTANLIYEDPIVFNPVNPPIEDGGGTWTITEDGSASSAPCNDPSYTETFKTAVTQLGSALVINSDVTLNAVIAGDQISGTRTYPEGLGNTTEVFTLTLGSLGDTLSGSSVWTWTDGTNICTGTSSYNGVRD